MKKIISKEFTSSLDDIMERAKRISKEMNDYYLGTVHFFLALLDYQKQSVEEYNEGYIYKLFKQKNIEYDEIKEYIYDINSRDSKRKIKYKDIYSPKLKQAIKNAEKTSRLLENEYVYEELILIEILMQDNNGMHLYLDGYNDFAINKKYFVDNIVYVMDDDSESLKRYVESSFLNSDNYVEKQQDVSLSKFFINLNDVVKEEKKEYIGHEEEFARLFQILSRYTKNNPCVIGEHGVGKTEFVKEFARRINDSNVPRSLQSKEIYEIQIAKMVAMAKFKGEVEEKLDKALISLENKNNVILFIDDIHEIINISKEIFTGIVNVLKPILEKGNIKVIVSTSIDAYTKISKRNNILERYFQKLKIKESDKKETFDLLMNVKDKYEDYHGVSIDEEGVNLVINYAERYMTDRFFPEKAIDVLDESMARAHVKRYLLVEDTERIEGKYSKLEENRIEALLNNDFGKLEKLNRMKEEIDKKEIIYENGFYEDKVMDEDIAYVVSKIAGVNVEKVTKREAKKLTRLESILSERVIGQEEAILAVSKAIRRGRSGIKESKRPIGSFLFLGPTGVGKTELSKALAGEVFGNERDIIRFDMSEYMDSFDVSKLVGSPPGYVGYDEGGQLPKFIRKNPYSVVLFDEIEKAHPDIFNIFLQILDEGFITDNDGTKVSFDNAVIIMTSNIGASRIVNNTSLGFEAQKTEMDEYFGMKEQVLDEVERLFKPEILNRIDEVVVFRALNKDDAKIILNKMVRELGERMRESKNISLSVSPSAKNVILESGFSKKYGARPLRRSLQTLVEDEIATIILDNDLQSGDLIKVGAKKGKLTFNIVENSTK